MEPYLKLGIINYICKKASKKFLKNMFLNIGLTLKALKLHSNLKSCLDLQPI